MTDEMLRILGGGLAALITVMGVVFTTKSSARTSQESIRQDHLQKQFDNLQEEVSRQGEQIEKQRQLIDELNLKLDDTSKLNRKAVNFIDQVALSIRYGRPIPRPSGLLADALDMSLWDSGGGNEPEPYHD